MAPFVQFVRSMGSAPPCRAVLASLAVLATVACAARGPDAGAIDVDALERVDMRPDDAVGFSLRNVVAPFTSIFYGGPSYFYGEREFVVETTPADGVVDLFYVRRNFQKRFEQADTPVVVELPPRINTGPRDALIIRAFAEGHRQVERKFLLRDRVDRIRIDLDPLPNTLRGFRHRGFAGRVSLAFLTQERAAPRIQESDEGFDLILAETALNEAAEDALDSLSGAVVAEASGQQLGEDLLLRFILADDVDADLRSRDGYDAARELYVFQVDVVPSDGGRGAVERALAALAAIDTASVTGCSLEFEASLRDALGVGALARALVPSGDFTDRYLRAAMRRLGELLPEGSVETAAGTRYRTSVPIELEAALSEAAQTRGFVAALRAFVAQLEEPEHRADTLRSLIAPEAASSAFASDYAEAQAREAGCRGTR